ncbi:MAG: hypothetical protein OEV42_20855 [Deltaproteobacteria bacterium]|nr:hypothetical protein [Deltaproteobacteria bacterium]
MQRFVLLFVLAVLFVASPLMSGVSMAEYGDKVLDRYASKNGMRAVVFPHWVHRVRITCKVCHQDLGFKMKLGANDIKMTDIVEGKFCGACHNGQVAWSAFYCDRCHTGTPTAKQLMPSSAAAVVKAPAAKSVKGKKKKKKKKGGKR